MKKIVIADVERGMQDWQLAKLSYTLVSLINCK